MLGNYGRPVATKVFTPLARLLSKLHITPNMVTVTGTVITIGLSVGLLARGRILLGAILLAIVLFCDSLDGVLARHTGKASRFGGFLDSTLDRIADGAVFGSLTAWAALGMETGTVRTVAVIAGLVAMVGAAGVPYARARAESVGIIAKVGIAERTDRLVIGLLCAALTDVGLPLWLYAAGLCWVGFASLFTVVQRIVFTYRALAREAAAAVPEGPEDSEAASTAGSGA